MKSEPRVLNAGEVAAWLRIPRSTLYKLCSEGKIPAVKVGKHWRFDRALVEEWFQSGAGVALSNPVRRRST